MTRTLDLTPITAHLDFLEDLIRESGYDAAAEHLFSYPMRGEPLMQGRDPISGYLNDAAPPEVTCRMHADALVILQHRGPESTVVEKSIRWPMDAYPGIVGFIYCIEDLRYPELDLNE